MAVNNSTFFDASTPSAGLSQMVERLPGAAKFSNQDLANELLRLSELEVPHDSGNLQNSGTVQPGDDPGSFVVGYNTRYAARLHEHPEYRFQRGRKGKYLEDPLKNNEAVFGKRWAQTIIGKLVS